MDADYTARRFALHQVQERTKDEDRNKKDKVDDNWRVSEPNS